MSDTFSGTIFTADWDASKFIQGIDSTIAAAQRLNEKTNQLTQTTQLQSRSFDENVVKMKKLEQGINTLEKSEKGSSDEARRMRVELNQLTAANDGLSKSMAVGNAELSKVKAQNEALQKTYARTRQEAAEFQQVAGRPISVSLNDGAIINKLQSLKTAFDRTFADAGAQLAVGELEKLDQAIIESKGEFEQISRTVDILREKLETLEPGTQQFEEVAGAIRAGSQVLTEYNKNFAEATSEVQKADAPYKSLRAQIAGLRNELTKMEEAGEENSEQFRKTQLEAARLTDTYNDQRTRLQILASDTKYVDFGVSAIQAAVSGYQTLVGVQELFGGSTEDTAKSQQKLLSVLNLVQGVQSFLNLVNKDAIIKVVGVDIATRAQAAGQRLLAVALGQSTGAALAFRAALLATGIGALAVAIVAIVSSLGSYSKGTEDAARKQENLNNIEKKAADNYAESTLKLTLMIDKVKQGDLSFKQKEKAVKEYNEEFGKTIGSVKDYAELEKKLIASGPDYIRYLQTKAKAQAAFDLAVESSKNALKAQNKTESEELSGVQNALVDVNKYLSERVIGNLFDFEKDNKKLSDKANANRTAEITKAEKDKAFFTNQFDLLSKESDALGDKLKIKTDDKAAKKAKASSASIENVYQKELTRLAKELAAITEKSFTSDETIQAKFAAALDEQLQGIEIYIKKKQLTKKEGANLSLLIKKIVAFNKNEALEDFHQKLAEVSEGIETELTNLQFDASEKRIANIQDQFQRENETIALEAKKQRSDYGKARREFLTSLENQLKIGEISQAAFDSISKEVKSRYALLFEEIKTSTAQKNAGLAEKIFNDSLDEIERTMHQTNLAITEGATQELKAVTAKYLQGEISYAEYQKRQTKILTDAEAERKQKRLKAMAEEIADLESRLKTVSLSPEAKKEEVDRLTALREAYAALNNEVYGDKAGKKKESGEKRLEEYERFKKYLDSVGQFISAIQSAWQVANDAEQQSIQKSIALQDKRVEAAQRIAERGNATYLRLEEDRQQQLLIKQESAARRQLAINSALQASQLLVGITGAIAQITVGGFTNVIAGVATIIGALASGYALVKSLQSNQPSFFEGTEFVRRDATKNIPSLERRHEKPGRDTIPAWLDEGEAVTDKETNKLYHPTIRAIHNREIPPEVLNQAVNHYLTVNAKGALVPQPVGQVTTNNNQLRTVETKERTTSTNTERIKEQSERTAKEFHQTYLPAIRAIKEGTIPPDVINSVVNNYTTAKTELHRHPVIQAIRAGLIPAQAVNSVVNQYPVWKMPQLNLKRMDQAMQVHVGYDARVAGLLLENTREIKKLRKDVKNISMKFNLDSNGFAAELTGFQDTHNIQKKL